MDKEYVLETKYKLGEILYYIDIDKDNFSCRRCSGLVKTIDASFRGDIFYRIGYVPSFLVSYANDKRDKIIQEKWIANSEEEAKLLLQKAKEELSKEVKEKIASLYEKLDKLNDQS